MIDSRYQLLEKIAESARGTVFHAHDIQAHRDIVIKRPKMSEAPNREAAALAHLQHPNVVKLEGAGEDEEGPYFVLEWLEGENLDDRIHRGALSVSEVQSLARQSLQALQAVHDAGFIHRDVKPENLMLLPAAAPEAFQVKLIDFDLAQPLADSLNDAATGSVYFMAPEQFENKRPDIRTDLYSLGAVLHYALTQRFPFEGETKAQVITAHLYHDCISLPDLRPDAPPALIKWLANLISLNPTHRPASASEALAQLEV